MATIRDVAERAGVAPITVSRVLNNSGYFSEETRRRVEKAAAELQYVPNQLARSLRSNRTDTLALVLTDITNPFWTTVARAVEDTAATQGFNVVLCNTDEQEEKQLQYVSVLLRKRVDGFLLVPVSHNVEPITMIRQQGVPVVVLDRDMPGLEADVVRCASEQGAHELISYLIGLGHRDIAVISGPETVSTAQERVAGYRRALTEQGLPVNPDRILFGSYTVESGYELARRVLQRPPRPTALFAGNNFIAIGALKAIREAGLQVPQDISVVSFDDLPPTLVVDPFLTVAAQSPYELGRQATELLLRRIAEPDSCDWQKIVLPTELIVRRSCRALEGGGDKGIG